MSSSPEKQKPDYAKISPETASISTQPPAYAPPIAQPNTHLPAIGSSAGAPFARPHSSSTRLIIDVHKHSWFHKPQILLDDVIENIPAEIEQRGVSREVWREWMGRFREVVRGESMSTCAHIWSWVIPIFVPCWCYKNASLQHTVRSFTEEFNDKVMIPHNMYFKTQTSSHDRHINNGQVVHEEATWIAIALTFDEVENLKAEENMWRFDWCSGNHKTSAYWNGFVRRVCCCGVEQVY